MSNPNYLRGRNLEYLVQHKLNESEYCIRSAGSHSMFDLISFGIDYTRLIQCKTYIDEAHWHKKLESDITEFERNVESFVAITKYEPDRWFQLVYKINRQDIVCLNYDVMNKCTVVADSFF